MNRTITVLSIIFFLISCNKNENRDNESTKSDTVETIDKLHSFATIDSTAFLKNWNNYVENPNEVNANILLDLLPSRLRLLQTEKEWEKNCLLFGNEIRTYEKFSKGIYKLDTLVIKKDLMATKLVLKMYFNTCLLVAEFGEIFDMDFAQMTITDVNFFLTNLKEAVGNDNKIYSKLLKYSFKNELYLNLDNFPDSVVSKTIDNEKRKRIEALLTVKDKDLIQLRDSLISFEQEN